MQTEHDFGAGRLFEAQPLGADGHATVSAAFDDRAHAPHIGPPRTAWDGAQDGTLCFPGLVPGLLWGLPQFAMDFMRVAMRPQGIDVRIGHLDFLDLLTGEVGRQPALPLLVLAFDFAFGVGRELHPMQTMQNSFSRSRIRSIRGAAGDLN
jgi:hypothetical protein